MPGAYASGFRIRLTRAAAGKSPPTAHLDEDDQRRPALAGSIGAGRPWTVLMISLSGYSFAAITGANNVGG